MPPKNLADSIKPDEKAASSQSQLSYLFGDADVFKNELQKRSIELGEVRHHLELLQDRLTDLTMESEQKAKDDLGATQNHAQDAAGTGQPDRNAGVYAQKAYQSPRADRL
jgi:glucose-6-phosphate isomerase